MSLILANLPIRRCLITRCLFWIFQQRMLKVKNIEYIYIKSRRMQRFLLLTLALVLNLSVFAQKRIVSLAPSLTQNLYLLGADDMVVGYTNYCQKAVKGEKDIVASAVKVNLEKVATLKPDIVYATTITNPEIIKQIQNFGIQVEVFRTPRSFLEICEQFNTMGKQVGKSKKAISIVSKAQSKVDSIKLQFKDRPRLKMLFQIGANPLYVVPPNSFMHDYMSFLNGENVHTVEGNGSISREGVLVRNPDVIFVTTMGIVGKREANVWRQYSEIKASRNNSIYIIDANKACSPTPLSFVETLEIMAFHIEP